MPSDVVMPQMGESIFEGTITKWLKKPGDRVQRDEPLFEISTDKVDAEIPSPASGVLKEIRATEGSTVQVNSIVAVIDGEGAGAQAAAQQAHTSGAQKSPELPPAPPPAAPAIAARPQPATAASATTGGAVSTEGPPPAPTAAGVGTTDIVMPQMGESIFEGTITKWLKKAGDQVKRDEPLFEISTDKVDAEIPAPVSGVLREIRADAGQTVQVNSVVATIAAEGAAPAAAVPSPRPAAPVPPATAPLPQPQAAAAAPQAPAEEVEEVVGGKRIRSSPLVRKLAREHDIDLWQVPGTGMGGRITKEDIQNFIQQRAARPAAPPPAPAAPTRPAAPTGAPAPARAPAAAPAVPGEAVPMSQMRKIIAQRMVESKRISAHVHSVYEVDMTRIANLRAKAKNDFERRTGTRLTFTTFFCRAAVQALKKWPIVNASVEGESIRYHRNINLGIAVALDWGLIVPVVKNAEEKNFLGVQRVLLDLAERARNKKLSPDDVQGGTFTITNPGQYGQMFGLPIIVQPQVAIMGIGSIKKQAVVISDENGMDSIAIRSICHISLGYDHRVIDGAVADQFLREVAQYLEHWNEELG